MELKLCTGHTGESNISEPTFFVSQAIPVRKLPLREAEQPFALHRSVLLLERLPITLWEQWKPLHKR